MDGVTDNHTVERTSKGCNKCWKWSCFNGTASVMFYMNAVMLWIKFCISCAWWTSLFCSIAKHVKILTKCLIWCQINCWVQTIARRRTMQRQAIARTNQYGQALYGTIFHYRSEWVKKIQYVPYQSFSIRLRSPRLRQSFVLDFSPGVLDFEMEKILESWFFQESCLKVPRVQNRWFSIILCVGYLVIQDGVRQPSWICGIPRFWPV